jgi:hypothetical protein
MFQVIEIKLNKFEDFKQSLWVEQDKIKEFCSIRDTNDLQSTLNTIFNPDFKEKLDLNTVDILFTRDHTYQLVYSCEESVTEVNYLASVLNYKRKPIKGLCVLVKIKLTVNDQNKLEYTESPMTIDNDITILIKDLFYHTGFKISSKIEEIEYDNKYNFQLVKDAPTGLVKDAPTGLVKDAPTGLVKDAPDQLDTHKSYDITLFGIPFKIWYVEGINPEPSPYLKDLSLFLNIKIKEAYVTSCIYPQCKTFSFDRTLLKKFIDLITTYPDEGELKDITVAYNYSSKNQSGENVYIVFDDFYWKVMKENRN